MPITKAAPTPGMSTYVLKLEYRDGALDGFAACQDGRKALEYGSRNGFPPPVRHVFEVDGLVVKQLVGKAPAMERPAYVAERDEAVFIYFSAAF
jgi:hypothetical protein